MLTTPQPGSCPKTYNPCDWFLDVISLDARDATREKQTKKRVQYLAEAFRDHEQAHPLPAVQRAPSVSENVDEHMYAVSCKRLMALGCGVSLGSYKLWHVIVCAR